MSTLLPAEAGFRVLRTVTLMVCGLALPRLVAYHTRVAGCSVGEYRSTVWAGPPSTETLAIPRSGPVVETHATVDPDSPVLFCAKAPVVLDSWTEPL
jgi:hypothetical protein